MRFEVDAVLFDIDGTLVDSTAAVDRAWRTWAGRHGYDAEAILAVCHGRRTEDTVADFVPEEGRADAVVELGELEGGDLGDIVALPGAAALLAALPAERWAAVTSGSRALMTARLRAAGLPVPEVLVTAEDVAEGKPDPEGYLRAAAGLGTEIARCLVVEDAPAGLRAGRASGARVLAVATSHDGDGLGPADAVVADLSACSLEPAGDGLVLTTTAGLRAAR